MAHQVGLVTVRRASLERSLSLEELLHRRPRHCWTTMARSTVSRRRNRCLILTCVCGTSPADARQYPEH